MAVPLPRLKRQRGVALITALLIVALATIAAVAMASRQQLDVRRTANILDGDQTFFYAIGVESWARRILVRDLKDGRTDHPGEDWARRLPPITIPGGQVAGYIEDLQGRFNLNNLLDENGQPNQAAVQRFQRLLELLELDPGLVNGVLDWMDSDLEARFPNGAEDDFYLIQQPPYRAANRPFASVSELRLVAGFDGAAMARLGPYLAALPGVTPLNVNTASALVLRTLTPTMSEAEAEGLIANRGDTGYKDVQTFLQDPVFAGTGDTLDANSLSVASEHFLVHADVLVGNARTRMFSVVHRSAQGGQPVVTRMRTLGGW